MTDQHTRSLVNRGAIDDEHQLPTLSERPRSESSWQPTRDLLSGLEPAQEPNASYLAKSAIWRDQRAGIISFAEAQRRSAAVDAETHSTKRERGQATKSRPPAARPRSTRPEPAESRQYSNPMATTAARDDRLTPQAKALLQLIRARVGKGHDTKATKGGLAGAISRSTRSIARYLRDLERCGYIETEIRRDSRGYHLGLMIRITKKVLPFFAEARGLAQWLGESAFSRGFMPFSTATPGGPPERFSNSKADFFGIKGMTLLSSKNLTSKDSSNGKKIANEKLVRARPSVPI